MLHLPERFTSGGVLYVYAHPHPDCRTPLRVAVNGRCFEVEPDGPAYFRWLTIPLEASDLRGGPNTVELWADSVPMDGWVLGLEGNVHATDSALSLDGGRSWRNDRMGVWHRLRGEYVVRLRLADDSLRDPPAPAPIWEEPDCPLLEEIRNVIPRRIRSVGDPWERARALCSWVSVQWVYTNNAGGTEYAPWDPLTILSWGKSARGQELNKPVVMCVHYGVVFAVAALALGIPARNLCTTDLMCGENGHFVSEVWIEEWRKWCQVDANCDLVYIRDGVPLSVGELHPAAAELPRLAVKGPGFQTQPPFIQETADKIFLTGQSFTMWAVWPRNDYLTRPDQTPPSHGSGAYPETDWLWAATPGSEELGMFPYRLAPESLQLGPPDRWRTTK